MNRTDIIAILTEWSDQHRELELQFVRLESVLGLTDGPLTTAVHDVADAHTEAVAARVGDVAGLLNFWRYETRFGEVPWTATIDQRAYSIDSIEALAGAIMETRRAETVD